MKNKYHLTITLVILIFIAFSCNREQNSSLLILNQAEQLMNEHPDSAMFLLNTCVDAEKLSRKNYAFWCLLITQARDKSYETDTSNIIIKVAVDYYEKHKNPSRLMLSYYEAGRIAQERGDAPKAQELYHKAFNTGQSHNDYALLGRISFNLGMLYLYQDLPGEALSYLKEAESSFQQIGDTVNISLSLCNIARTYNLLKQNDLSINFYNEALNYAEPDDRPSILNEIGIVYMEKGNSDSAFIYVKEALNGNNTEADNSYIYLVMGEIYKKTGAYDSANYYLNKVIDNTFFNIRTVAGAYYHLYHIAKDNRQWEKYAVFQEKFELLSDSLMAQTHTETLMKIESLYNYEKALNEANVYKLKNAKNNIKILLLTLFALFISVSFIGALIYYLFKKNKRKSFFESLLQKLDPQKNSLFDKQMQDITERIDELEVLIKEEHNSDVLLFEKNILSSINDLILFQIQTKNTNISLLQEEAIYIKLHSLNTKKITDMDYRDLYEAIEKFYPNFYSYIKNFNLSEENIQTASLIKANLGQSEIRKLTGSMSNTVTMRFNSLSKKLLNGKIDRKALIKHILDL